MAKSLVRGPTQEVALPGEGSSAPNAGESRTANAPDDANVLDGIRETAQLPAHLAFIDEVLGRYPDDSEDGQQLSQMVARLRRRVEDPRVYLGVIGEFSAGKSTLINALIGDELLCTDILQGTTSAATLVQFGRRLDAEVLTNEGGRLRFSRRSGANFQGFVNGIKGVFGSKSERGRQAVIEWIHRYSANEDDARRIARLTIEHPAAVLQDGLVIVDTPGLNAENERHVAVTVRSVSELCDAFIIVIPATSPASELLISFVKTHLEESLHRCLFVVTKVDLLRNSAEVDRVEKTVKGRLAAELGAALEPVVLSCAPEVALNVRQGKDANAGRSRALPAEVIGAATDQFDRVSAQLLHAVHRNRLVVVLESTVASVGALLKRVEQYLASHQRAYRTRHETLVQHEIGDLESFLRERRTPLARQFRANSAAILRKGEAWLGRCHAPFLQELRQAISSARDRGTLKQVLSTVPEELIRRRQALVHKALAELSHRCIQSAKKQQGAFEADFRNLYEMLDPLEGQIHPCGDVLDANEEPDPGTLSAVKRVRRGVTLQTMLDTVKILGMGLFVGAVAGAATAGFGAIFGMIVGAWLGTAFRKPIDALCERLLDEEVGLFEDSFENIKADFQEGLKEIISETEAQLLANLDEYGQRYAGSVADIIKRDHAERASLVHLHNQANQDRKELANRSAVLKEIRDGCVAMQTNESTPSRPSVAPAFILQLERIRQKAATEAAVEDAPSMKPFATAMPHCSPAAAMEAGKSETFRTPAALPKPRPGKPTRRAAVTSRPRIKLRTRGSPLVWVSAGALLLCLIVVGIGIAPILVSPQTSRYEQDRRRASPENLDKLRIGMTLNEIEQILGGGRQAVEDDSDLFLVNVSDLALSEPARGKAWRQAIREGRVQVWHLSVDHTDILAAFPEIHPSRDSQVEVFLRGDYRSATQMPSDKWVVSRDNYLKLRVGMTLKELEDIIGAGESASFLRGPMLREGWTNAVTERWTTAIDEHRIYEWKGPDWTPTGEHNLIVAGFPAPPSGNANVRSEALCYRDGRQDDDKGALSGTNAEADLK